MSAMKEQHQLGGWHFKTFKHKLERERHTLWSKKDPKIIQWGSLYVASLSRRDLSSLRSPDLHMTSTTPTFGTWQQSQAFNSSRESSVSWDPFKTFSQRKITIWIMNMIANYYNNFSGILVDVLKKDQKTHHT